MSGGLYDYLCFRDEYDIFGDLGDLRDMPLTGKEKP